MANVYVRGVWALRPGGLLDACPVRQYYRYRIFILLHRKKSPVSEHLLKGFKMHKGSPPEKNVFFRALPE